MNSAEAKLLDQVSRSLMQADLGWLARHGVRRGGSPAEREAAMWVAERLRGHRVECEVQEFDAFVSYAEEPDAFGPAYVHVLGSDERFTGKVYAFSQSPEEIAVEGDLVVAGIGSDADYENLGVDARGRIVLTDLSFGLPHSEPARIAQARGAAGLIVANWSDRDGPRTHTSTAKWVWGNPTFDDLGDLCRIPVAAVSRNDGAKLRERAQQGARVSVQAPASLEWVRAAQPVAHIPGASDRFVLFQCHLDAFGAGVTDNGTGIAGLIELARVLRANRDRLGVSVRLAWWACHEMPYDGSTWYLDTHWDELRDRCIATFNADSWALEGSSDRPVALAFAEIQDFVHEALRDGFGREITRRDFDFKEGEQTFWSPGISSAFLFSATPDFPDGPITGPWFHTEYDTIEHVDYDALEQLVRAYALIGARIGAAGERPLRPGRLASRLLSLLEEIAATAPAELELDAVIALAERFWDVAVSVESLAEDTVVTGATMRASRIINPVMYTIVGPYGQDPVAASFLRRRLPALRAAVDGLAASAGSELVRSAWFTQALRERNRLADALAEAVRVLDGVRTGGR